MLYDDNYYKNKLANTGIPTPLAALKANVNKAEGKMVRERVLSAKEVLAKDENDLTVEDVFEGLWQCWGALGLESVGRPEDYQRFDLLPEFIKEYFKNNLNP